MLKEISLRGIRLAISFIGLFFRLLLGSSWTGSVGKFRMLALRALVTLVIHLCCNAPSHSITGISDHISS